MFYNPGGVGGETAPRFLADPSRRIREVNYLTPLRHCGIHYWFENEKGIPLSENAARSQMGRFTLHIRASCNGFLTVFDIESGVELAPRTDPRWSGYRLGDTIFRVPGVFESTGQGAGRHIIIVWARSQTEVAGNAEHARRRLVDMPVWMTIVRESDESTPGEIGTYVVNRGDAGVPAEIVFRRR